MLNDHLSKATEVGKNPRSEHVQVFVFQSIIFAQLGFSTALNIDLSFAYNPIINHLTV